MATTLTRKYGSGTFIYFPLYKTGSWEFAGSADYTPEAGDVKITKDGNAPADPTNALSTITVGNGEFWQLELTAAEMQAYTLVITIIDAPTKAVKDEMIVIETYEADDGEIQAGVWADALLNRPLNVGIDNSFRSVRQALRPVINKTEIVDGGTKLVVYKEDDTAIAWTADVTRTSNSGIVRASDTPQE